MNASVWDSVQNLINILSEHSNYIQHHRDSLYYSNVNRDREFHNTEYCVQCAGLCFTKISKLQHLSQLLRKLDRTLDTLGEVLMFKARYLPPPLDLPPSPPPSTITTPCLAEDDEPAVDQQDNLM